MTIRNKLEQVSDGDQLNEGYFNDIQLRRKSFSDASTYTHTGDTNFTNVASFTFGALNAALLTFQIKAQRV